MEDKPGTKRGENFTTETSVNKSESPLRFAIGALVRRILQSGDEKLMADTLERAKPREIKRKIKANKRLADVSLNDLESRNVDIDSVEKFDEINKDGKYTLKRTNL